MGSRGSVGELITTQKRGRDTVIRQSPKPTDPYSLPQAYQRWIYKDYAYLWTQQTPAVKQQYATNGSRYHLTGFQYWLRIQLKAYPNLLRWYRLDAHSGATTLDSSPFKLDATITSATPIPARINGGYYFDGLNDKLTAAFPQGLQGSSPFTLQVFLYLPAGFAQATQGNIICIGQEIIHRSFTFWLSSLRNINIGWYGAGFATTLTIPLTTWANVAVTFNGLATLNLYYNGVFHSTYGIGAAIPNLTVGNLTIGGMPAIPRWLNATLDDIHIFSGIEPTQLIFNRAQRIYPR